MKYPFLPKCRTLNNLWARFKFSVADLHEIRLRVYCALSLQPYHATLRTATKSIKRNKQPIAQPSCLLVIIVHISVGKFDSTTSSTRRRIVMFLYLIQFALVKKHLVFTVQRYALHGLALYGLSYRNSVCPSVTLVHCVHMVRPTIMISSTYGSPIILVSGDITFIPKFEGGHPERGRWMRVGWVRIGDFRPISRRISETVRDTT